MRSQIPCGMELAVTHMFTDDKKACVPNYEPHKDIATYSMAAARKSIFLPPPPHQPLINFSKKK
jgi:hypothetical protein